MDQYLQRGHGRAPRGKKVHDVRPGRRFKRVNVIGGMQGGKHMATMQYEHTTTSEFFEGWFRHELLPRTPKGYTIVMDNARFHRKAQLLELARESKVRLLFLPPYSPDLNPIEHGWANMKKWLRDNTDYWGCLLLAINEYFWWKDYCIHY